MAFCRHVVDMLICCVVYMMMIQCLYDDDMMLICGYGRSPVVFEFGGDELVFVAEASGTSLVDLFV